MKEQDHGTDKEDKNKDSLDTLNEGEATNGNETGTTYAGDGVYL